MDSVCNFYGDISRLFRGLRFNKIVMDLVEVKNNGKAIAITFRTFDRLLHANKIKRGRGCWIFVTKKS